MGVYAIVIGFGGVQLLTLCLCGVLWWFLIKQERSIHLLSSRLRNAEVAETGKTQQPESFSEEESEFSREFREAELKANLQMAGSVRPNTMDKYKYVASMADKGLGVEDLAQSFGISSYEAEQLVNLSRLAQNGAKT
jgi:hypothetical protein